MKEDRKVILLISTAIFFVLGCQSEEEKLKNIVESKIELAKVSKYYRDKHKMFTDALDALEYYMKKSSKTSFAVEIKKGNAKFASQNYSNIKIRTNSYAKLSFAERRISNCFIEFLTAMVLDEETSLLWLNSVISYAKDLREHGLTDESSDLIRRAIHFKPEIPKYCNSTQECGYVRDYYAKLLRVAPDFGYFDFAFKYTPVLFEDVALADIIYFKIAQNAIKQNKETIWKLAQSKMKGNWHDSEDVTSLVAIHHAQNGRIASAARYLLTIKKKSLREKTKVSFLPFLIGKNRSTARKYLLDVWNDVKSKGIFYSNSSGIKKLIFASIELDELSICRDIELRIRKTKDLQEFGNWDYRHDQIVETMAWCGMVKAINKGIQKSKYNFIKFITRQVKAGNEISNLGHKKLAKEIFLGANTTLRKMVKNKDTYWDVGEFMEVSRKLSHELHILGEKELAAQLLLDAMGIVEKKAHSQSGQVHVLMPALFDLIQLGREKSSVQYLLRITEYLKIPKNMRSTKTAHPYPAH